MTENTENTRPIAAPEWFDFGKIIESLDAREMIAKGEHPLTAVIEKGEAMKEGDIFELITPFQPMPLIEKMKAKGFDCFTEKVDATTFKNFLFKTLA